MTSATSPAGASGRPMLPSWRLAFWAVLLVAFILYIPSLGGRPVWDDTELLSGAGIGGGTLIGALTKPFLSGYFRPLVSLTLLFENNVFQGSTFYYHLVNVFLHLGGCAVLMGLLLLCFQSRRVAMVGGLVMAVHPVLVSTIAWIGGITDCLGTLLVSLFLLTLVKSIIGEEGKRTLWRTLSVVFFLLGLFCKEQTIALILLVPMAPWAFASTENERKTASSVKLSIPYIAWAVVFLVLWKMYFPGYPDIVRTAGERVLTIGQSLAYYTLVLLFPTAKWLQTYSLGSFSQAAWTWAALGFSVFAAFTWTWFKVLRSDPRLAWFGAMLILSIVPVANIIPPPSLVLAPYRAGLAVLGLAAVLGVLVGRFVRSRTAMAIVGVYCLFWAALTYVSVPQWSDQQSLFTAISQADPDFLTARRNLAMTVLSGPGDPQKNGYDAANQLIGVLDSIYGSPAWRNPAGALQAYRSDERVQREVALNKGPMIADTWLSEVFVQLGEAWAQSGDPDDSKLAFEGALSIRPTNFTATVALAQLAIQQGNYRAAETYLESAGQLKPGDPGVAQMLEQVRQQLHAK